MRKTFAALAVALVLPAPAVAQDLRKSHRSGAAVQVKTDPITGAVASVGRNDALLTEPSDRTPEQIALGYARENHEIFRLSSTDIANLELVARAVSPDGITHLRFNQTLDGIESYDSGLIAHVAADGRLITVSGKPQPGARLKDTSPEVSALASLGEARRETGGMALPPRVIKSGRTTTFATGEAAQLRWIATAGGARLAWDVYTGGHSVVVDAASGDALLTTDLTDHAGRARYFPRDPARNAVPTEITMPPAWYDQHNGGTRLWGQYARTYIDETDADPAPGAEGGAALRQIPASSGTDWLYARSTAFPGVCPGGCSWTSPTRGTAVANERQAATNVHVLTSRFLEHLAQAPIGFDVASGAFKGNDYVQAEVNDGEGFDNANFATPPNGTPPRMQMFLFDSNTNGSDVADIVYHEIGHGLSSRLIVNASGVAALDPAQSRMMGEGWSDFYALDLLEAEGWIADTAAPGELHVATHVREGGIRNKPPDCPVDPAGIPGCNDNGRSAITVLGGYTYGDLASTLNTTPHNGGELWTAVLWDLRKAVGRQAALALITGGMRLTPDSPSMTQARDAIVQQALAMRSAPGAADDHYATVWRVFTARGFGHLAGEANAHDTLPVENFAEPPNRLIPGRPTVTDPYPGGDNDGATEPGEQVEISVPVSARGLSDLPGVTGTVSFDHPGVTVQTATAAWPLLGLARTATNAAPFVATLPSSCASSPTLTINLTGSSGTATATKPIPIGPGSQQTVALNDATAKEVAAFTDVSWVVESDATIADVDVRIDELRHTFLGDLEIHVIHAGQTVQLLDRVAPEWFGQDIAGAIFDSDATTDPPSSGLGPIAGRMRPAEAAGLDRFDGKPAGGTWTLRIADFFPGDAGTLRSWGADGPAGTFPCPRAEIPAATTGGVAGATVSGTVTPNGRATGLRFAYGTSTAYGSTTAVQDAGAGDAPVAGSAELSGLAPGTTYHYRVEAIRENGVVAVAGADRTFTTPPPPPPPAPIATPVPPATDRTAPSFTRRATVKLAKAGKKRRATFSFALSEPARVSAEVTVAAKGIRKGARCVAVPKKRPKGARSCTRQVRAASGTAGAGTAMLRIAKTLGKGAYTAKLTAVDAAGNRASATVRFTIR